MIALLAMIDPLSPTGKALGTLLGLGTLAASVYLVVRQRPGPKVESQGAASTPRSLVAENVWRLPTARLMAVCAILILVGSWLDPTQYGKPFVVVWASVLCLVMVLLAMAGFDMLTLRRRAFHERIRLMRQNQAEMETDLKECFRSTAHRGNGTPLDG